MEGRATTKNFNYISTRILSKITIITAISVLLFTSSANSALKSDPDEFLVMIICENNVTGSHGRPMLGVQQRTLLQRHFLYSAQSRNGAKF
jgi:hypothetical protein